MDWNSIILDWANSLQIVDSKLVVVSDLSTTYFLGKLKKYLALEKSDDSGSRPDLNQQVEDVVHFLSGHFTNFTFLPIEECDESELLIIASVLMLFSTLCCEDDSLKARTCGLPESAQVKITNFLKYCGNCVDEITNISRPELLAAVKYCDVENSPSQSVFYQSFAQSSTPMNKSLMYRSVLSSGSPFSPEVKLAEMRKLKKENSELRVRYNEVYDELLDAHSSITKLEKEISELKKLSPASLCLEKPDATKHFDKYEADKSGNESCNSFQSQNSSPYSKGGKNKRRNQVKQLVTLKEELDSLKSELDHTNKRLEGALCEKDKMSKNYDRISKQLLYWKEAAEDLDTRNQQLTELSDQLQEELNILRRDCIDKQDMLNCLNDSRSKRLSLLSSSYQEPGESLDAVIDLQMADLQSKCESQELEIRRLNGEVTQMTNRLQEFSNTCCALKDEISELSKSNVVLKLSLAANETVNREIIAQKVSLEKMIDELKLSEFQIREEMISLAARCESESKKNNILNREHAKTVSNLQTLSHQVELLQNDKLSLNADLAALKTNFDEVSKSLNEQINLFRVVENDKVLLQDKLNSNYVEMETLKCALNEATDKIHLVEAENAMLNQDLKLKVDSITDLLNLKNNLSTELENKSLEISKLKSDVTQLRCNLADLKLSLSKEISEKVLSIEMLNQELANSNEQVIRLKSEAEVHLSKLEENYVVIQKLERDCSEAQKTNDEVVSQRDKLISDLGIKVSEVNKLSTDLTKCSSVIDSLSSEKADMQTELNDKAIQIDSLSRDLAESNTKICSLESESLKYQAILKENTESINHLKEDLSNAKEDVIRAASEKNKLLGELNEKLNTVQNLKEELAALCEKIDGLTNDKVSLESALEDKLKEIQIVHEEKDLLNKLVQEIEADRTSLLSNFNEKSLEAQNLNAALLESLKTTSDSETKIHSLEFELEKSTMNNQELSKELGESKTKINNLESELGKKDIELQTRVEESLSASQKIATLEKEKDEIGFKLQESDLKNENLLKELDERACLIGSLKSSNATLEFEIGNKSSLINDLKKSIRDLNEKISKTEAEKSELDIKLANFSKEATDLRSELSENSMTIINLQAQVHEFKSDLRSTNDQKSIIEGEKMALNSHISELDSKINILETERTSLKSDLSQALDDVASLNDELVRLKRETSLSQETNTTLTTQLEIKSSEVSHCLQQITCLNEKISGLESNKADLENKLAANIKTIQDLYEEKSVLSNKNAAFETDLKEQHCIISHLKEELCGVKTSLSSLSQENEGLKEQLQEKTCNVQNYEVKVNELNDLVSSKNVQIDELNTKLSAKAKLCEELSLQLQEIRQVVSLLERDKTELQHQLSQHCSTINVLNVQLDELNASVVTIEGLKADKETLKVKLMELQNTHSHILAELEKTQLDFERTKANLEQKVLEESSRVTYLENEKDMYVQELSSLKEQLEVACKEYEHLKEELRNSKGYLTSKFKLLLPENIDSNMEEIHSWVDVICDTYEQKVQNSYKMIEENDKLIREVTQRDTTIQTLNEGIKDLETEFGTVSSALKHIVSQINTFKRRAPSALQMKDFEKQLTLTPEADSSIPSEFEAVPQDPETENNVQYLLNIVSQHLADQTEELKHYQEKMINHLNREKDFENKFRTEIKNIRTMLYNWCCQKFNAVPENTVCTGDADDLSNALNDLHQYKILISQITNEIQLESVDKLKQMLQEKSEKLNEAETRYNTTKHRLENELESEKKMLLELKDKLNDVIASNRTLVLRTSTQDKVIESLKTELCNKTEKLEKSCLDINRLEQRLKLSESSSEVLKKQVQESLEKMSSLKCTNEGREEKLKQSYEERLNKLKQKMANKLNEEVELKTSQFDEKVSEIREKEAELRKNISKELEAAKAEIERLKSVTNFDSSNNTNLVDIPRAISAQSLPDEHEFSKPARPLGSEPKLKNFTDRRQSLRSIPAGLGNSSKNPGDAFTAIDEEGEVFDSRCLSDLKQGIVRLPQEESKADRLSTLKKRNSMLLPHLRSSYAAETQFFSPKSAREEELKQIPTPKVKSQRAYRKPGPPTPTKKNNNRDSFSKSVASASKDEAPLTPRRRLRSFFSHRADENTPPSSNSHRLPFLRKKDS